MLDNLVGELEAAEEEDCEVARFKMKEYKFTTQGKDQMDGMTVFNAKKVDTKKQPMFFGKPLGVQRYDLYKYLSLIN